MNPSNLSFLAELRYPDGTERIRLIDHPTAQRLEEAMSRGVRGQMLIDHLTEPDEVAAPSRLRLVVFRHGEPILERVFFGT